MDYFRGGGKKKYIKVSSIMIFGLVFNPTLNTLTLTRVQTKTAPSPMHIYPISYIPYFC